MHSRYIIICIALLLFASCGRQQQAKSIVKDFMEQHLHQDVSYLDFSDVDSTQTIGDSLIQVLHQRAGKNIAYQQRTGQTLFYIRAKYLSDKDTLSTTFYLDRDLHGVVAFKENDLPSLINP